jgi:uncharacterized membrane protein
MLQRNQKRGAGSIMGRSMNEGLNVGKREWGALALVLALALALRLFKADASLWYDEIFTVVNYVRLPTSQLVGVFDSLNNHMLYSLLAQASVGLLGENPAALRLPAILFGVGSIFVQWRIARRMMGAPGALVVALLLALSYHHVWFSQNARGYTGLLFFCSAATLAFIKGLEKPGWRIWASYGLLVAAAMYTHMSAGFFFVAHGVVYAWMAGRALLERGAQDREPGLLSWGPIFGIALSIVITLMLYAPVIQQALSTINEVSKASAAPGGAALAEWRNPLRAVQEIGRSISSAGPLVPVIVLGALLVLAAGVIDLYRRSPVLVTIYVVHVPLAMLLLYIVGVRIWPRYFFVDIGFIFMAIVEGVYVWSRILAPWLRWQDKPICDAPWIARFGMAMMVLVSIALLIPNYLHPKQDFTGARDFLRSYAKPGDSIAAIGLAGYAYGHYYAPEFTVVETGAELKRLRRATKGRSWVVIAFPNQTLNARPDVKAELVAHYTDMDTFKGTLGDGEVWTLIDKGAAKP